MKALFICHTYMQVIIAIQTKLSLFADDDIDVILSNSSLNADKRAEGLRKTGLFRRVRCIEVKAFREKSNPLKLIDAMKFLFEKEAFSDVLWDDDIDYDQVYFYNPSFVANAIVNKIFQKSGRKKIPELISYEEGVLSYGFLTNLSGRAGKVARLSDFFNRFKGSPSMFQNTRKFMCYYPEVLKAVQPEGHRDISTIRIPLISRDSRLLSALNTTFDYDPSAHSFPQKYVYFSTSADIDGHPVGETEIILKLADLVGKDNLLVKVHPRDGRDVFARNGLPVSRDSSTPWEVIQLNHDFTAHVFISLSSGSIINVTAMMNENIPTYMLYPLVAGKDTYMDTEHYARIANVINALKSIEGVLKSVKITDKLEDVTSF